MRSELRSPCAAPVRFSTSSSISRCAAKPTISRSKSASELFSSKVRRRIISSVIVGSLVRVKVWRPNPTGDPRCPPPWISGPLPPDSRRSRQRATYPQLLHHLKGHDRPNRRTSPSAAAARPRPRPPPFPPPHAGEGGGCRLKAPREERRPRPAACGGGRSRSLQDRSDPRLSSPVE